MNRRENKDRIAEHGWLNVLRSSCMSISLPHRVQNKVFPLPPVEYSVKNEICTISGKVDQKSFANYKNQHAKAFTLGSDDYVSMDENATTSTGLRQAIPYCRPPSVSSITSTLPSYPTSELSRKRIIEHMIMHLNDEKEYINAFIQLIQIEEDHCDGNKGLPLEIPPEEMTLDIFQKLSMKGSLQCRASARKEMLQRLLTGYNKQNEYKECFDRFLSMEENFLNED